MKRLMLVGLLLSGAVHAAPLAKTESAALPAVFREKNLDCYTALLALRRIGAYDMQWSSTAERLTVGGLAYDAGENMLVVVQKTANGGEIVALVECRK